jgi:hypothetical protein
MAMKRLPDYPSVIGPLRVCILDVDGPTSYATGGQAITAQAVGMNWIEFVSCSGSSDKLNTVRQVPTKGAVKTAYLMWSVAATGAEVAAVVDLSAKFVRVMVFGR